MDWSVLADNAGLLAQGLLITLEVSALALLLAFALGTVVATLRVAPAASLRGAGAAYVEVLRNVPLLVQLFFLYFALPSIGVRLDAFVCGVLALGIYTSAFVAEAMRSGIAAVPRGQLEAGLSSGMRYAAAMRLIVLPQAVAKTIPPLGNTTLNLIKNSSLVSTISVLDILGTANLIGGRTLSVRADVRRRGDLLPHSHAADRARRERARAAARARMNLTWLFNEPTLRFIAAGLGTTLELAAVSIAISFAGGVALALARLSRFRPLSVAATMYIEGMRALPVLLVIFFAYFALPRVIGVKLEPFAAAVIALSAFTAALVAEIVRAGILSVPAGLIEAAQSQGFTGAQIMRIVSLPIALRRMMPALVAQFVTLLKDTSLTAVINILELTRRGQLVYSQPPFQPVPVFALIAAIYFIVNFGLGRIGSTLEARTV